MLNEVWDKIDGVPAFFLIAYSAKSAEVASYCNPEERREVEHRIREIAPKAECIIFASEMRFVTKAVPTGTPMESQEEILRSIRQSDRRGIILLTETREGIVTTMCEIKESKSEDGTVHQELSPEWKRVDGATLGSFFPPFFAANRAN